MSGLACASPAELLERAVAGDGRATALVCGERRISYAELDARVDAQTATLAAAGVRAGDPVGLLLGDGPAWPVAFFAIARAGAVAVPLSPRFTRAELEFCRRGAGVRAVVGPAGLHRVEHGAPAGGAGRDASGSDGRPEGAGVPSDAAVVHWSSGSTGRPKRVVRTHAGLAAEAASIVGGLGLGPEDRILCTIPLFHTYGLGCCLLAAVAAGATLVLTAHPEPLVLARERLLADLERERATVLPTVPFALRALAEAPGAARADLSSLRLCCSAATPLPRATFDAFAATFGVAPRQLYGTTETGAVSANVDDDPRPGAMTVGTPLPGAAVRVVDAAGDDVEPGRIGDLLLRTEGMAAGYAGAPPSARGAFAGGWFASGDRGRVDEAGRVVVTGRAKLLIDVRGSEKVDPIEVEDVLAVHPRVREVAVVGAASGVEGEQRVKAVVVPDGRCTERELMRYCRERLAAYKVPSVVELRDELPRGPGGKLLRKDLV